MYGHHQRSNGGPSGAGAGAGYTPIRSSGSRMWGMSSSLPSGMSDYAVCPPPASSYPPPSYHYHSNQHPHYNGHSSSSSSYHHHHHGGSRHHSPLHDYPAHQLHHPHARTTYGRGLSPSSQSFAAQDADFGASFGGQRRLFNEPAHLPIGGGAAAPSTAGLGLSASSSTSLTGADGLTAGGSSYNGIGAGGGTNLIVNYLPQDMNDRELFSLFRTMGPIESCRIMRDFRTNYSYGYAFVNFVTEEGAKRAIKCLNGVNVRNKRLKVSYARPAGEEIKDTNLYVTNLPKTITEEQIDVIFGKYGLIVQKNILRDKITGKPRGVAFIRFNKREEAQEAIAALNNVIPEGSSQPLTVRVADEHGKSKAQQLLAAGFYNTPISVALAQQKNPNHQQQQHLSASQLNMNTLGLGGSVGGAYGGSHLHHPNSAMHRGRTRNAPVSGAYARPMHSNHHHNYHRPY